MRSGLRISVALGLQYALRRVVGDGENESEWTLTASLSRGYLSLEILVDGY